MKPTDLDPATLRWVADELAGLGRGYRDALCEGGDPRNRTADQLVSSVLKAVSDRYRRSATRIERKRGTP